MLGMLEVRIGVQEEKKSRLEELGSEPPRGSRQKQNGKGTMPPICRTSRGASSVLKAGVGERHILGSRIR